MIKCDVVAEVRPLNPAVSIGYGPVIAVTTCRTHGLSVEGVLPLQDGLCIVGRIERLETLLDQVVRS